MPSERSSTCYASTHADGGFYSFMYTPVVASLFGLHPDAVFPVSVRDLREGEASVYWAWWSNEKGHFIPGMIWPQKGLVEMCFTYGSQPEVKAGRGEIVNVVVERIVEKSAEDAR